MKGYNNENVAYDFSEFDRANSVGTLNVATNKSAVKSKFFAVKNIVLVAIIAAICAVWVNGYAKLTELTADITSLKSQYETLQSDNDKLNVQYTAKIDLAQIQNVAVNDYSMQSINRNQISYLSLDGEDVAEVIAEKNGGFFGNLAKRVLYGVE